MRVDLRARLLRVVGLREGARADSAFDIDEPALVQLRRKAFGGQTPHHYAVPLGPALTLAVLCPYFVRRDREPRHWLSALRVEQFGVTSEVADERYLVDQRSFSYFGAGAGSLWAAPLPYAY